MYILLGILWIVLVTALAEPILTHLKISAVYASEVRFAILCSVIVFAFANA